MEKVLILFEVWSKIIKLYWQSWRKQIIRLNTSSQLQKLDVVGIAYISLQCLFAFKGEVEWMSI